MADDDQVVDIGLRISAFGADQAGKELTKFADQFNAATSKLSTAGQRMVQAASQNLKGALTGNTEQIKKLEQSLTAGQKSLSDLDKKLASLRKLEAKGMQNASPTVAKSYESSKKILQTIGLPGDIETQINTVKGKLKRLEDLRHELARIENYNAKKDDPNYHKSLGPKKSAQLEQLRGEEAGLKAQQATLTKNLTTSQAAWKHYLDARRDMLESFTDREKAQWKKIGEHAAIKDERLPLTKKIEEDTRHLQVLKTQRERVIATFLKNQGMDKVDDYRRRLAGAMAGRPTDLEGNPVSSAETMSKLKGIMGSLTKDMMGINELINGMDKEILDTVPEIRQVKNEWEQVAKAVQHAYDAEAGDRRQKGATTELARIEESFAHRQRNMITGKAHARDISGVGYDLSDLKKFEYSAGHALAIIQQIDYKLENIGDSNAEAAEKLREQRADWQKVLDMAIRQREIAETDVILNQTELSLTQRQGKLEKDLEKTLEKQVAWREKLAVRPIENGKQVHAGSTVNQMKAELRTIEEAEKQVQSLIDVHAQLGGGEVSESLIKLQNRYASLRAEISQTARTHEAYRRGLAAEKVLSRDSDRLAKTMSLRQQKGSYGHGDVSALASQAAGLRVNIEKMTAEMEVAYRTDLRSAKVLSERRDAYKQLLALVEQQHQIALADVSLAEKEKANTRAELAYQKEIEAVERKQRNWKTNIDRRTPEFGQKIASHSQIVAMETEVNKLKGTEAQLNEIMAHQARTAGGVSQSLANLTARYAKAREELEKLTTDQRALRTEMESTAAFQRAQKGFSYGMGAGMHRTFQRYSMFKTSTKELYTAGAEKGGTMAGLMNVGKAAAGVAAILIPLKLMQGAATLAMKAFHGFINVVHRGIGTIQGFIQRAVEAHMEVVQFSKQTGIAQRDSQKLVGVFKALGLDAHWMAVGLEALNREVIKNNKTFLSMGIATRTATGEARPLIDVLKDLNTVYKNLDEQGKTNFIANMNQAIPFGSMIMPLLTVDWDKFLGPLEQMNIILDEVEQKKMTNVTASFNTINMAMTGVGNTIAIALAPAIKELANLITNVLVKHMGTLQKVFERVGSEIIAFVRAIVGAQEMIDFVGTMAAGMDSATKSTEGAGQAMDLYANTIAELDGELKDVAEQQEGVNEKLDAQRDILEGITEARDAELDVINEQQDAIKEALDTQTKPMEKQITLLERQANAWKKARDIALDAINSQIDALQKANKQLSKDEKKELKPLTDKLDGLKKQRKDAEKTQKAGRAGGGGGSSSAENSAKSEAEAIIKSIDAQMNAVKRADDAWEKIQQTSIKGYRKQQDALDDQVKAIKKASDAREKAAKKEKDLIQDQIDLIQDEQKAVSEAGQEQEYWDRRAYLTGQTLIAQLEARSRALSDRQARQRTSGESDVDYQLRIQQLNLQNDIESQQRQDELRQLDQQHFLEQANKLRQEQVDILQAQMDAIDEQLRLQQEADDAVVEGITLQKEQYGELIDRIQEAIDKRKEDSDVTLAALDLQREGAQATLDAIKDTSEAASSAASEGSDTLDGLDAQIDDVQDQIDGVKDKYDGLRGANDDLIEGLEDQADAVRDLYDGMLQPVEDQIETIKGLIEDAKNTAQDLLDPLEDIADAIHDVYDPQIKAQQKIVDGLEKELKLLNAKEAALKKEKTAAGDAKNADDKNKSAAERLDDFMDVIADPNGLGARIGTWVRDAIIQPFKDKSFADALTDALGNVIGTVVPPILWAFVHAVEEFIKDNPMVPAIIVAAIFIPGPTVLIAVVGLLLYAFRDAWMDWVMQHKVEIGLWSAAFFVAFFVFPWALPGVILALIFKMFDDWIVSHVKEATGWIGKIWDLAKGYVEDNKLLMAGILLAPILVLAGAVFKYRKDIEDTIRAMWDMVDDWLKDHKEDIAIALLSPFGLFLIVVDRYKDDIKKVASKAWSFIVDDIVKNGLCWAKDFLSPLLEVPGMLMRFAKNIVPWAKHVGTAIGEGIADGLSALPGLLGDALNGGWDFIVSFFKRIGELIASVLEVFGLDKIAQGILDKTGDPKKPSAPPPTSFKPSEGSPPTGDPFAGGGPDACFEEGGIITRPTQALMGEAGHDEFVITTDPRHKKRSLHLVDQLMGRLSVGGPLDWADDVFGTVGDVAGSIAGLPGKVLDISKDAIQSGMEKLFTWSLGLATPSFGSSLIGKGFSGILGFIKDQAVKWFFGKKDEWDVKNAFNLPSMFGNSKVAPSQGYGRTWFAMTGNNGGPAYADGFHSGVDVMSLPGGSKIPLFSPGRGKVTGTGNQGDKGLGKWISMAFGKDLGLTIGHLDTVLRDITAQSVLQKGQRLGYMGTTGNSTGVHTHIETFKDNKRTNPEQYLPAFSEFFAADQWKRGLQQMARGGIIKPNSTLLDANGFPYAQAGHGLETVTPVDFLKNVVGTSVSSSMQAAIPSVISGDARPTVINQVTIGDVYANTREDAAAVSSAVVSEVSKFFEEMKAHAPAVMVRSNR